MNNTRQIDFEDYIQEKHSEQYIGLDDDMPDDCNDWLYNLDPQELIDFGQEYADKVHTKAIRECMKALPEAPNVMNRIYKEEASESLKKLLHYGR